MTRLLAFLRALFTKPRPKQMPGIEAGPIIKRETSLRLIKHAMNSAKSRSALR